MDKDISNEINYLSEQISLIDSNLKFNITIFLGLLTLFFAVAGWALATLTKAWVHKSINSKVREIKVDVKENVLEEIKNNSYVKSFELFRNGYGAVFKYDRLKSNEKPLVIIDDKSRDDKFKIELFDDKILVVNEGRISSFTVFISNCRNIEIVAVGNKDFIEKNILKNK